MPLISVDGKDLDWAISQIAALELRIQKLEAKLFALLDPGQVPTEADFDWARAIIETKQRKNPL